MSRQLTQTLEDSLLDTFTSKAQKKFGPMRGAQKKALIEALNDWIKQNK